MWYNVMVNNQWVLSNSTFFENLHTLQFITNNFFLLKSSLLSHSDNRVSCVICIYQASLSIYCDKMSRLSTQQVLSSITLKIHMRLLFITKRNSTDIVIPWGLRNNRYSLRVLYEFINHPSCDKFSWFISPKRACMISYLASMKYNKYRNLSEIYVYHVAN